MSTDYKSYAQEIDQDTRSLIKAAPEAMSAFRSLSTQANSDGALDRKTKELMALAISVATHCDRCITFHARAAAHKGASREEVVETLEVAIEMGGGPSVVYGAEALAAFDAFAGA